MDIAIFRSGVVTGRQSSIETVEVLGRRLRNLKLTRQSDTTGAALVDLKRTLLNRIFEVEEGKARAVKHLVDSAGEGGTEVDTRAEHNPDSAIA